MDCWQRLKIEPTNNIRSIKRAYARLIKQYSPESDPDAFQTIRHAFEDAKKQAAYIHDNHDEAIREAAEPNEVPINEHVSSSVTQFTAEQTQPAQAEVAMASLSDSPNISSANHFEELAAKSEDKDEDAHTNHYHLPSRESEQDDIESAISAFQAEFWQRFESLLNNTEVKLEQWQALLNSELLFNLEIKQLLHYQVFESLVQIISEAEKNTKLALNRQVVGLLADTFGWRDNELALANAYGYDGVSLVMEYDSPIGTNRQRVIDEINQEPSFLKKSIYPVLSWIVLLGILYFAITMMSAKRESTAETTRFSSQNQSSSSNSSSPNQDVSQRYIIENCRRLFDIKAVPLATEQLFSQCQSFAQTQEDEYAALYIGSAKFLSSTLPLDLDFALSWLVKSADQGNEQATFWLGVLLEEGRQQLQHDEESQVVLSSAHYMGSRYARPYLTSTNLSKQVNEKNLEAFDLAVYSKRNELGHIAIIAQMYYRFIMTHRQSSIPQYDLNEQSVQEVLKAFSSIISEGTDLERSRLLHLILAYTTPYKYDAELKQIADTFISDTHQYQDIETYLWVAAFKAYSMDFGSANAIVDMAKIKLQQSQAYFAPDYLQYLTATMSKQKAAYKLMSTVHIPLGDANIRQLAREMVVRTKQLAIKQLVEG